MYNDMKEQKMDVKYMLITCEDCGNLVAIPVRWTFPVWPFWPSVYCNECYQDRLARGAEK